MPRPRPVRLVLPPCNAPLHEQWQRSVLALLHRLVWAIAALHGLSMAATTMV